MHDPSILALSIKAPIPVTDRWQTRVAREGGRRGPILSARGGRIGWWHFRWADLVDVWHDDPNGADAGSVCDLRPRGLRWWWQHRRHLRFRVIPYRRVKSWLTDRCDECGRRFFWRDVRIGAGWDSPKVLHDRCHGYRSMRGRVADLAKYVRGEANWTEAWRVAHGWGVMQDRIEGVVVGHGQGRITVQVDADAVRYPKLATSVALTQIDPDKVGRAVEYFADLGVGRRQQRDGLGGCPRCQAPWTLTSLAGEALVGGGFHVVCDVCAHEWDDPHTGHEVRQAAARGAAG